MQNPQSRYKLYADTLARDMTLQDAVAELERELHVRQRVYGRLIENESLTLAKAQEQYTALRVALDYLKRQNQPTLF